MQVLRRKWILAIHLARRTRFGGRPVERDPALARRTLEHDHDHGWSRRREAAPAYLPPIGSHRAARLGVPQDQTCAAALHRSGRLQDHATDRVARLVVHDIGAVDGPAERAVVHVDRGTEATVADECALAPPGRETVPEEVLA